MVHSPIELSSTVSSLKPLNYIVKPLKQRLTTRKLNRNFQKFSSGNGNKSLQSSSLSLTGFNIQAFVTKNVTSESWEAPHEHRPRPVSIT